MDEVNNILNSPYYTRNIKQKLENFMEKYDMTIEDFPKKLQSRVRQLLFPEKLKLSGYKRKKPEEDFDNNTSPPTKKIKQTDTELLKIMIQQDIKNRKEQSKQFDLIIPTNISFPTFKDVIIIDDDYDSEEDEDYNPEKEVREDLETKKQILEIFGKGLKKKESLDLSCIESEEEKLKLQEIYESIKNLNNVKTPLKIKVLQSHLPLEVKATIIKKLEMLDNSFDTGDSKKFYDWIESILKIPFNIYCPMPISNESSKTEIGSFLDNFYGKLDKAIYGQNKVKQVLTETIAKWITHPTTKGHALAIVGPPGVGKTSLIREGLAKGLNRPFCSLSLAGMHDEAYLTGFAMTYEGSQEGRISKMLKKSKCMNPIIFMDELDKVDTIRHGLSIMNKLIEITDFSQNHEFEDLYYQDVKLDISKAIFVFSLNHLENVDPILRDRLEIIHVDGFETPEKIKIAQDYLIPNVLDQLGFQKDDIIFSEKILRYIMVQLDNEKGVRKLKEAINKICRKINMLRFTNKNTGFKNTYELPLSITEDIVDKIIIKPDKPFLHMYS